MNICGEDAVFLPVSECDDCEKFINDVARLDQAVVDLNAITGQLSDELDGKQDALVAGSNISMTPLPDGTVEISASGGGALPDGGDTGQLLAKRSDADGDVHWVDPGAGGSIVRIMVNDTSLLGREATITDGVTTQTVTLNNRRTDVQIGAMAGVVRVYAHNAQGKRALSKVEVSGFGVYPVELKIYGFFAYHYSENDSNPESVTYPSNCDNHDYTPFSMDMINGVPDYGDWSRTDPSTAWLYPRSCMLRYDTTVDYYLDENDEEKKADGTASDVGNLSYNGNAMMEWGQDDKRIYWKLVPDADEKGFTFYVADEKVDADYDAWNHYDVNGQLARHFYTAKYFGGYDGVRLRSISGTQNYVNNHGTTEIANAKANNLSSDELWNIDTWCDRLFVWMMLCLIGKSMNTQAVFGMGVSNSAAAGSNDTLNGKGLFCGYSDPTKDVKVFGMQGWWGFLGRRCNGLISSNGTELIKLTHSTADGSSSVGYNTTGAGYLSAGAIPDIRSGGPISAMRISRLGLVPKQMAGSDQTYYCDYAWADNGQVNFGIMGGNHTAKNACGASCFQLNTPVDIGYATYGSALSCKPLAE